MDATEAAEGGLHSTVAKVADANKGFGVALQDWHDGVLSVELPNPKSRLTQVYRISRWLLHEPFQDLLAASAVLTFTCRTRAPCPSAK